MDRYFKCPNCKNVICASDNEQIAKCNICGKNYINPYFSKLDDPGENEIIENTDKEENLVCRNCGKQVSNTFEYCPYCGTKMKVKCSNCGKLLGVGHRFCSYCGTAADKQSSNENSENDNISKSGYCVNSISETKDFYKVHEEDKEKTIRKSVKKYEKQKISSLVKNSICLVIAVILFAFAFCPIVSNYNYLDFRYSYELSGIDYIDIMFASALKYDAENDAERLKAMSEELDELEEQLATYAQSCVITQNGRYKFNLEYKTAVHKWNVETSKYNISQKDNSDTFEARMTITVGVLCFIYIIVISIILTLSFIAFVFSILNMKANNGKQMKYWEGYSCLLAMPLFLSIGIIFCIIGRYFTLAMIFRLLFECIAIAFIMANACMVKDKNQRKQAIFKVATVMLCVIIAGLCFAPAFRGVRCEERSITTSEGKSIKTEYKLERQMRPGLFGLTMIGGKQYETYYKNLTHEQFISRINSGTGDIVQNVYFDLKTYEYAEKVAVGYYCMLVAIIFAGMYACLSLLSKKEIMTIRRIIQPIIVVFFIVSIIIGAAMCGTVNNYLGTNKIEIDYKLTFDCGLILAVVFACATFVTEYLPTTLERKNAGQISAIELQNTDN